MEDRLESILRILIYVGLRVGQQKNLTGLTPLQEFLDPPLNTQLICLASLGSVSIICTLMKFVDCSPSSMP